MLAALILLLQGEEVQTRTLFKSEKTDFILETVAPNLDSPWGIDFLPDGILITERDGRMRIHRQGKLFAVTGLPDIAPGGQGGLLDVAVSPSFDRDQQIYLTFSKAGPGGRGTALASARLRGTALTEVKILWEMEKKTGTSVHFGSRIRFLADRTLIFTTGERGDPDRAQDLADSAGKVHRLNRDGTIPSDNPFVKVPGALPSIYSYGHRNPQGLVIRHSDGTIWLSEHGPQGGDEINLIKPGKNYGWPVITYGRNYVIGTKIGEGTSKPGMEQPLLHWTPSIAPSGLDFYSGGRIPAWQGNLFSGALAGQQMVRMEISGTQVLKQEVVLEDAIGRIREVREGPDGYLYLATDESNGGLYRIGPP